MPSSSCYLQDPEPFTDQRHFFVKTTILEPLATEKIAVSFPPIRQRSIAFAFFAGEMLRHFVERRDKNFNGFNDRDRDTASIDDDRKFSFSR